MELNKKGEYHKPVLWTLAIIFVLGAVFFSITSAFDENIPPPSGVLGDTISFVENGQNVTIPVPFAPDLEFNFNFLAWFGDTFQEFVANQLTALSILPSWVLVPLLIMILFGLIWIIKLVSFG